MADRVQAATLPRSTTVEQTASFAGENWSPAEVRDTVRDYLTMLLAEVRGTPYSKTNHRRRLMSRLREGRTEAAIEFKHQNISAAMVDLGLPYITGYRPRGNYQGAIVKEIGAQLREEPSCLGELIAGRPACRVGCAVFVAPPRPSRHRSRSTGPIASHVDYVALQAENLRLGRLGEELVIELERQRLTDLGRTDLAASVRWVASIDGDAAGFDVGSYESNGTVLHIEVKTTSLDADTPFYLSSAELAFAREHIETYRLYRVYNALDDPRVFVVDQPLDLALELVPVTFRARLAKTRTASRHTRGAQPEVLPTALAPQDHDE
jgi:hypothetical protein